MARTAKAEPTALGPQFPTTSPPDVLADVTTRQELLEGINANIDSLQIQLASINIVAPFDLQTYFALFTQSLYEHALTGWKVCALAAAIVQQAPEIEWRPLMESAGYTCGYVRQLARVFRSFEQKPAFHALPTSKLLELSRLPEPQQEELASAEQIDEIDRMSVREVKALARKLKADAKDTAELYQRQIAAKNEKLDALDREVSRARDGSNEGQTAVKHAVKTLISTITEVTISAAACHQALTHLREQEARYGIKCSDAQWDSITRVASSAREDVTQCLVEIE